LTFGSYRLIENGECLEEALFYADDLPSKEKQVLERYVRNHSANWVTADAELPGLLTRRQFLKKFYRYAYKARCLVVAFNFPFDVSRIAYDVSLARRRFAGGFSLGLWSSIDKSHREFSDPFRPRIGIKQIDNKRALKGFVARGCPDEEDRIPEGSRTGKAQEDYVFHGHFLDLRTLVFALTDRGHSLKSACEEFSVEHPKQDALKHGVVTTKYIDYNRRDVLATAELAERVLAEYDKHGLQEQLQETKAYSPASVGKAYLRKMGIKPILERQPDFPKKFLGYAQSAFFGGRTSAHIRKVAVPVVYTDFLSMYPTVNGLMELWNFVTAQKIRVVENCGDQIHQFFKNLNLEDLFSPVTWRNLNGFVKIVPQNDILPFRSKFGISSNDWQVAVNYLTLEKTDFLDGIWFSLPDVVASFLLTNQIPQIVDAFRLEPKGKIRILSLYRRAQDLGEVRPDHYVFPACEASRFDPMRPQSSWRTAWRNITRLVTCPACGTDQNPCKVCCNSECKANLEKRQSPLAGLRFHDLRHHAITELAESQASDSTIMAIAGHVSPKMLQHYSHIRLMAKRAALDAISITRPDQAKSQTGTSGYDTNHDTKQKRETARDSQVHGNMVELVGIEPTTSSLRTMRSPS